MRTAKPLLLSLALSAAIGACTKPAPLAKSSELAQKLGTSKQAISVGYAPGTLIIPMDSIQDTTTGSTIIKAYGLVTQLALNNIDVDWAISATKAVDGADITGLNATTVWPTTNTTSYSNQSLYGGPFIIDASNATAAMSVITAWNQPVQVLKATSAFATNIQEQIVAAPRIAIDDDGYEYFAFNYLNGAGITDSQGNSWPTAQSSNPPYTSPDTLTPTQIGNGALQNSDSTPLFTNLTSMHYNGTIADSTVLGVQNWLKASPLTMAVMECAAITAFENDTNGHFLTTNGFTASSTKPANGTVIIPTNPLNQLYITGGTALTTTSGLEAEMNLAGGSSWYATTQILAAGTAPATNVLWATGPAYGNANYGIVSYLAGHDYQNGNVSPPLPISSNNLTNGVRMYLDAFLQTAAIQAQYQPNMSVTISSPAVNAGGVVTYTINYANNGFGVANTTTLTDVLPTGMTYQSSTGGGVNTSGTVKWTLNNLQPGTSGSVTVTGKVTAGGTYTDSVTLGWLIGRTSKSITSNTVTNTFPVTTITSSPANPTTATSATFTFVSSVTGATFQCKLDAGSFASCTSPVTYTSLSAASHTFSVESIVSGGNTELTPPTYTWNVEVAPVVTITPGTGASTFSNSTSATFALTATKPISTWYCSLDGAAFTTCTSSPTFTGLSNATHTLLVNATDTTGLSNVTPASYSWTVNTVAPTATISTGPASLTNATTASFTFTSNANPASYVCKLSPASTFTSSTSCTNATFSGLSAGSYTLQIEAKDEYGNTSAASNTWSWTVETTPPTISITAHPAVLSNSSSASFTLVGSATAPATVSSYVCSLDGTAYAACPGGASPSYTGLANGQHTFLANVIDSAGNTATAPASFTWTINTTAPTATITAGPSTPTNATTADFTFTSSESPVTYTCKLSPATTFTPCPVPPNYSGLSNGTYSLVIEATDQFGNTSVPSAAWTWTVDTTPPTVTIATGPAAFTNATSANFTITATDTQPISKYLCALDGAAFTTCSASPSYPGPLTAGQHTLQANVVDAAGNTAVTPATWTWTIGTTKPVVTILTGPANPTDATTAVFTFSSSESPTTYQCKLSPATSYSACPANNTYTGLTNGSYTFSVIGTDQFGNVSNPATWTWTVDTTAPVVTITSGPALETNATSATFVISASDTLPISTYLCSLDGAPFANCSSTKTYAGPLSNGPHTFLANAQDTAGNVAASPASYTWTINTNPPTVTIVSGPPSPTNMTTATFVFSSNESPVTYVCELSPATTYTPCPASFTGLTNGPYTLKVKAMDQYGNTSTTPAIWTWTVDTTLPLISIVSGPALQTNQTTANFVVQASDTLAITSYLCSLDGAAYTTCSTTPSYTGLMDGTHVFHVTAIDAAGNQAAPPASYTWTIDTQIPTFTITSQPSNPTNQTTATFTFSSPETLTYYCELAPATTFTVCPVSYTNLPTGMQTITIYGVDPYGNQTLPQTVTWNIDTTAPVVTITSGPAVNTNATTATFVISAVDTLPITTYLCSLDGAPFTNCTSTKTYNGLMNGTHTFLANAMDTAGNEATVPAAYTWTINTNPPTVMIVSGPSTPTNMTTATFVFSSNESPVTYLCELSPATTYTPCPSTFTGLTNGPYTLMVEAMDQYGNTSTTPAIWNWTVDTTLPLVTITSGPALQTNQTTASFVVVATDTLAITSYLCSLDGGTYAVCSTTPSYSGLMDGTHVFHVTAIDAAGNQAAPPASYTWTIDTQTPTFTITSQPSNPTDQTTATFTFSSPEDLTYYCELAPATTFTICPVSFTNLPTGTQTVTIYGVDPYGNQTLPQTVTWNIDTTLPAVTITSGPASQTNQTSAAFVVVAMDSLPIVSYQCSLDFAAFTACSSTPTYSGLTAGPHVFEVTAIDSAGNVGAPPAVWNWTIKTQAPTFTIVSGPPMMTNSPTATFVFSSPDPGVTYLCKLAPATTYTPCPPTFTGLTNGPYTLMVEAMDPYGNVSQPQTYTWTVDMTPPTIQILTGPPLLSNSSSASFTLAATDTVAIATYLCGLDGAAFTTCTATPTFTGLTNGSHTLLASATDILGNTAVTPASYTWTINTQPPTTTIVNGPPTQTNSTTAIFVFSSDESPVTYLCELTPATTFTPCPVPPVFTGLSDGTYTLTVAAEDQYGNIDPNPPSYTWTVTTTLPVVTIVQHPPLLTNQTTANFMLQSSVVVSFLCSLDGAPFASCTSTPSYTGLADGPHTLLAGGKDASGNTANPPASYTWTIHTTPPTTQIVTKPPQVTNSTTGSFTFSSSANPATYLCELSPATTFTPCPIPPVFNGLSNGQHTLTVASEDEYGNIDPNPPSYTWTVNTVAPVVTITSGPGARTAATTADFTLTSSAPLTTYLCALDGAAYTMCSSTPTWSGLTTGAHTLSASGLDAAGNMAVPGSYSWTVLPALPNTTILTMPTNPSAQSTAVFTFGSSASPVTFQCELDGATSFTACTTPGVFPDLADGSHTLTVRAMDSFGQVDPNPPSYTWVVDTTPPTTTIVTAPPAITNSATANFTFSSNKSPVTYECELDNATSFTACSTPDTITGLANGQHVLQVRAKDSAGLVDPVGAVAAWTVNTITPVTIILTGPDAKTTETTATFTFTANETPVTYECSVDSTSDWTTCTSPTTLSSVALGAHTFHVRAKDDAGNIDPNPPSYPWTVEPPTVQPPPESLQFRGARLGCASSTTGMWAVLGLLPLFFLRRRRLARVRGR
jgi:hypothetical protein